MKSPRLFILLLAPFLIPSLAVSAEPAAPAVGWPPLSLGAASLPPDDVLVARGAVIGEIYVRTEDIFDPSREEENKLLFRVANRLHRTTRPEVVERKLLFASGDPYDPRVLHETARYLRSQNYLYDATVRPIRYRDGRVDVLVVTRDVWTLSLDAGLERAGGENSFQVGLKDRNFLGTGRQLDVKYSDDEERSYRRFRYIDTALLGSRAELRLWYSDNSDGHRHIFDLAKPFYALDSRWAAAAKATSDDRRDRLYSQGEIVRRYRHRTTQYEISAGLSKGAVGDRALRWRFGYTYDEHRFASGDDEPFPLLSRRLSYPWIGFDSVEDRYVETHNMDRLVRTEDFNLGTELAVRLGFSSTALGAYRDQAIFSFGVQSGWQPSDGQILFLSGHAGGRWGDGGHENVIVGGDVRYFLRTFGPHRLQVALRFDAAWNLDPESQLLLGGDNGLRGYPRGLQDGDRRFLLTLEHRFYTQWELFKLVHVGAAVFVDVGRAWYDGRGDDREVLKDVGLGLRLGSSRSSQGTMVHLDVAYPLDGDSDEIQWLVTSRETF